jgi:hypothetical protein
MEENMETKHTPGPWTAWDDDGTGTLPCVLSDKVNAGGNFYVAQCNVYEDARLIAAAPDLLEALDGILNNLWKDRKRDVKRDYSLMVYEAQAKAAISKARGTE